MLVKEQKVPLFEKDLLTVNEVGGFTLDHVDEFYIVMAVLREVNKAGVRSYVDKSAVFKNSGRVDLLLVIITIVKSPIDSFAASQYFLLLFSYGAEFFQ